LVERGPHVLDVGIGARALEDLRHEVAPRRQRPADEIERKLDEIHGGRLVRGVDAADVRCNIADDQLRLLAAEGFQDLVQDRLVREITLDEVDVLQGIHGQDIGGNHPALLARQARGHLRPAARSRAEIDNEHPGTDQPVPLIEL